MKLYMKNSTTFGLPLISYTHAKIHTCRCTQKNTLKPLSPELNPTGIYLIVLLHLLGHGICSRYFFWDPQCLEVWHLGSFSTLFKKIKVHVQQRSQLYSNMQLHDALSTVPSKLDVWSDVIVQPKYMNPRRNLQVSKYMDSLAK